MVASLAHGLHCCLRFWSRKKLIFFWFVGGLWLVWQVCGWFGLFVGDFEIYSQRKILYPQAEIRYLKIR